jgi:hypothetical protein
MTRHQRPGGDRRTHPPGEPGEHAAKLSGMRPLAHDDDERPSREDRDYGSTIFTRPAVPLPRFLRGARRSNRRNARAYDDLVRWSQHITVFEIPAAALSHKGTRVRPDWALRRRYGRTE